MGDPGMTDYFVFDLPADARTAMQQIDDARGFSDPRTKTATWAIIKTRATDGKNVFPAPPQQWRAAITVPYTVEEKQDDWFPVVEQLPA
jgi:hypothetical protein